MWTLNECCTISIDVHVVLTTRLLILLVEKDNDKFNIAMLQDKKVSMFVSCS